jgi:hypothetical protein
MKSSIRLRLALWKNLLLPCVYYFAVLQKSRNMANITFVVFNIASYMVIKKNTVKAIKTHGKEVSTVKFQKNTQQRKMTRQRAAPRVLRNLT